MVTGIGWCHCYCSDILEQTAPGDTKVAEDDSSAMEATRGLRSHQLQSRMSDLRDGPRDGQTPRSNTTSGDVFADPGPSRTSAAGIGRDIQRNHGKGSTLSTSSKVHVAQGVCEGLFRAGASCRGWDGVYHGPRDPS